MRRPLSLPIAGATLAAAVLACGAPPEDTAPAPSATAAAEPPSIAAVVADTAVVLAERPHAFALVESDGERRRTGRVVLIPSPSDVPRFRLEWDGDPPAVVASDGRVASASAGDGDVTVGPLDRAGGVLLQQRAGKLMMTALRPASFGQYGGELLPEQDGVVVMRTPLPNGGGWELAVGAEDRLPRRVAFRSAPEAAAEVLELEPLDEAVDADSVELRVVPGPGGREVEFFAGPAPGDTLPAIDFELADGSEASLADYRGSAVVLDFWATWCIPCRPAMAELEELYQEFGEQGLEVLGLRLYDGGDPSAFLESVGVTYPIGDGAPFDEPLAIETYGLPTLYVLDREGRIVDLVVGYEAELTPPKVRAAVIAALG